MTSVQTIAKNVRALNDFTSVSYRTEQRGAWSLDIIILEEVDRNFKVTMEVSNDGSNWWDWVINGEFVDRLCGASFTYDYLPYDYVRINTTAGGNGLYDILFNER
jgi:hypothetical protein